MQTQIANVDFNTLISTHNNQPVTTSVQVAQAFKKQHKHVLDKIDGLLTQVVDSFGKPNFRLIEIETVNNLGFTVKTRAYELTKDGFMLLVMGFTGKAAMAIKVAYINAFNQMFEQLSGGHRLETKTTPAEREGLRQAVNYLVGKRHLHFDEAYRLVHQRFNVGGIEDIPAAQLPQAVAYCHALALDTSLHGEVIDTIPSPEGRRCPAGTDEGLTLADLTNLKALCVHMRWVSAWFRHYYPAIKLLNNRMAGNIHDHFNDGSFCAASLAKRHGINLPAHEQLKYFPWEGDYHQQHNYLRTGA